MDTAKWATVLKTAPLASKLYGGEVFEIALNDEIAKKDIKEITQDEAERVINRLTQRDLIRLIKKFNNEQFNMIVVKAKPKMLKFIKNLTVSLCVQAFESDFVRGCLFGVKIPKVILRALVGHGTFLPTTNGTLLKYIDSDLIDKEIAEAAFAEDKTSIIWIKNPTRTMIEEALDKNNRSGIQHLVKNNLLNETQLKKAIGLVPPVIEFVNNLTPELVTHAITCGLHALPFKLTFKIPHEFEIMLVRENCANLALLFDPDVATMTYAAHVDPYLVLKSDKYPFMLSEEAQIAAASGTPEIIFSLKNPTDAVIMTAITKNPYIVTHHRDKEETNFKPEHILAAIKQEPKVLNALYEVPNEVQIDIIKQSPERIKDIKKPTKEAVCLYISLVSGNTIMNPDIDFDVPDELSKYFK